ncbi:MAG: ATP-binding protein [Caldilineaceae bacterium]|nr:ATP-binding protein [Caldilineaceae bacterium]
MTQTRKERIAFNVETSRILEILSSEIYDSPTAFLRENVQNAYDAILMRCTAQNTPVASRSIEIIVESSRLIVRDDGIGMNEDVLKNNFWKAGSSGKKTELAQRSGVIGTFGIGAMANFGVCTSLRVETRHIESSETIISSVHRDDLRIAEDCIDLETVSDERDAGTLIVADLDPSYTIDEVSACDYLRQYVRFLPVPVAVNGTIISQEAYENTVAGRTEGFKQIASRHVTNSKFTATLDVSVDNRSRLLVRVTDILLHGNPVGGEVFFVQEGGSTFAFRNSFGLAPVPVPGQYGLAGFVNLNILNPTAGREALSRDSIQHIADLVSLIEAEASADIAGTDAADGNQQFQQYILSHNLIHLAHRVGISVLPKDEMIALGAVRDFEPDKSKHYYTGRDSTILSRFASQQANLFHVSQTNPRRGLQARFLTEVTRLEQVPERTIVDRIPPAELTLEEAVFLAQLRWVLLDDYLMPEVDVSFATISHGVAVYVEMESNERYIAIARDFPAAATVINCYKTARDVFNGFVKDFVRQHIYPNIRAYVPSSTSQGSEALYRRLMANKELYQLEEGDYGGIEAVLAEYMSGETGFTEVLKAARNRASGHRQEVTNEQTGSVEEELPDIIESPALSPSPNDFGAIPPILRSDVSSQKKVLTVADEYPGLNEFRMFLAVSDRLVRREGEFLHQPHTTRTMWGAHRIIYVFTDATGGISLYYDIDLKTPLEAENTGGEMFPTTTIVTKNRIYIPVPSGLEQAFQVVGGTKEFYVNFNTIP